MKVSSPLRHASHKVGSLVLFATLSTAALAQDSAALEAPDWSHGESRIAQVYSDPVRVADRAADIESDPATRAFDVALGQHRAAPLEGTSCRVTAEDYPAAARAAGIEGYVAVEVAVDAAGRAHVERVAKSLSPECDAAAVAVARRMRWQPARNFGVAVADRLEVRVRFELEE